MNKSYIKVAASTVLALFLISGCSNNEDPVVVADGYNGVFVDAAVQGLSWECGGIVGITDAAGTFGTCPAGSTVTFKLGNVTLGSSTQTTNSIFTPQDLAVGNQDEANKIASLLLSMDSDPTDEVITITPAIIAAYRIAVPVATNISAQTQAQVEQTASETISKVAETDSALAAKMTVKSAAEAAAHLVETKKDIDSGKVKRPKRPKKPTGSTGAAS